MASLVTATIRIPSDVHAKLKAEAAMQGKNLYDYIIELLTKAANGKKK